MVPIQLLIDYANAAVGGGYVYGSSGQTCSPAFRESCAVANPSQRENIMGTSAKWDGKKVWDCSGIFRGASRALYAYRSGGATTIWKTWCTGYKTAFDPKSSTPAIGAAVFRANKTTPANKDHVGVYIGDGNVVEAKGASYGVLVSRLADGTWTDWALLDDYDYAALGTDSLPDAEDTPIADETRNDPMVSIQIPVSAAKALWSAMDTAGVMG